MPFFGIYFRFLPHTLGMESENKTKSGIVLSPNEAEEYCEFKRQKRIAEVAAELAKSELYAAERDMGIGDLKKIADSAKRVKSAAVRVNPVHVPAMKNLLGASGVFIDCLVGGTGETLVKAKGYEAKLAVRSGAKEITLILCYSAIKSGRTGDTKREIKRVCRAARKAVVKVAADKTLTYAEILRLGQMAADCGAKFLTVEFFPDCGRLKRDLHDSCMLEVTGVETAGDYKTLITAGAERIGTSHAEEIYAELMKEAENLSFAVNFAEPLTVASPVSSPAPATPAITAASTQTISEKSAAKASEGTPFNAAERGKTEKSEKSEKPKAEQMSVLNDKKLLDGVPGK